MRVVVMADLGQRAYHVGDEAIGLATKRELEARGAEVVLVARHPERVDPALRGGPIVMAPEVAWDPAERLQLLAAVKEGRKTRAGRRALARPDVAGLRDAIASADQVHIAGGGNHTSLYGWLLVERAVAVALARQLDIPVTMSGQTLGPSLHHHDRVALSEELAAIRSITVRDAASAALASELVEDGDKVRLSLDDATFLAEVPIAGSRPSPDHISATFSSDFIARLGTGAEELLADALTALSVYSGLPVRFEAHMEAPGEDSDDAKVHRQIASRMETQQVILEPVRTAQAVSTGMATAALVISSRFHPIVFACAAGVPAIALGGGHYANVRLDGVLGAWGLEGFRVDAASTYGGNLVSLGLALLEGGPSITNHLQQQREDRRAQWASTWDVIANQGHGAPCTGSSAPRLAAPWGATSRAQELADRLESERERLFVDLDLAGSLLRHFHREPRNRRSLLTARW